MAKKNEYVSIGLTVEQAVASYFECECPCCTKKQSLKTVLEKVRVLVSNQKLTLKNLKEAIKKWFEEGWAVISKDIIQITRSGRAVVKKIAEEATAPSVASPV